MTRRSFGSQYASDASAAAPLGYLDAVAAIPAVAEAKEAASQALGLRAGDRVLELGCGTGVDLPGLAQTVGPTGAVVGVDHNAAAVEAARPRVADLAGVDVARASIERLPFEDGAFDAARADRTLQHVPDPEAALAEIFRVLRPGGRLAVLEVGLQLEGLDADREVTASIKHRLVSAGDQAWLPLMLPPLLKRAGFDRTVFESWERTSTDVRDADAALRLTEARDEAVADGSITPEQAVAWDAALHDAVTSGRFVLRMLFLRFLAERAP